MKPPRSPATTTWPVVKYAEEKEQQVGEFLGPAGREADREGVECHGEGWDPGRERAFVLEERQVSTLPWLGGRIAH